MLMVGEKLSCHERGAGENIKSLKHKTVVHILRCPLRTDRYTLHLYALPTKI